MNKENEFKTRFIKREFFFRKTFQRITFSNMRMIS